MPYTFLTYVQAKQTLAQRLYETSTQFYMDAELGQYVLEALQSFNALGNFYRQEFIFNSRPGVTWYDLTDTVNLPNTLRALTTTDQAILNFIQYHLLEPLSLSYPLGWSGSKQFALVDILNAIQQVRDQMLSESGCTVTDALVPAVPGRTFLPDSVLDIRRVAWIPVSGFGYGVNMLMPSDIWAQQSFDAGFPQADPATPLSYRQSTEPPLSFDVDIQPAVPGQYDVLTVNSGGTLSSTAASILPIPNDWCWVVKWGALAQLLNRDSSARDAFRAQYATLRYKQGVAAMRSAPALLAARINDVPVFVDALRNGDFYRANWQGLPAGQPDIVYCSGLNMAGLANTPDAGPYGVTASVVRNMVLPASDSEFLQVGRDDIGPLLDEAQHLALFKCGGAEFAETFELHRNFIRHCALYNSKLRALSPFLEMIDGRTRVNDQTNPTFTKPDPATVGER